MNDFHLIKHWWYLGFKSGGSQRLSQISAKDPNIEEYWFVCQKWFDSSEGDKQTVRDLLPTDENGNVLSSRQGSNEKTVSTYLSNIFLE